MVKGLYTAATGMQAQAQKMDIISNDLANANTAGYKKDVALIRSFDEVMLTRINDTQNHIPNNRDIGTMSLGAYVEDIQTNYRQGALTQTNDPANVALQGTGFFEVQDDNGQSYYTRDGNFLIDSQGRLVTQEGLQVMGENGPIVLGSAYLESVGDLQIDVAGVVSVDGVRVDRLNIIDVEEDSLEFVRKMEANLYTLEEGVQIKAFEGTVTQGYIELSNVNVVEAMVDMITVSRAYQMNQKMIQLQDQLIGKAVNEVGKA